MSKLEEFAFLGFVTVFSLIGPFFMMTVDRDKASRAFLWELVGVIAILALIGALGIAFLL